MAGTCLRWTGRCSDVFVKLAVYLKKEQIRLIWLLHKLQGYFVTQLLDGPNRSSSCKTAEKAGFHLVWQSRPSQNVTEQRSAHGSGWHGPSRMTLAWSRNWRSLSRSASRRKKVGSKDCRSIGKAQSDIRIHHNTMAAHDDKKRKRAAEGADAPNKKASSAAITVRFPAPRDELHPVIGMRILDCPNRLTCR